MHKQFYSIQDLLTYIQQSKGGDIKALCELDALPAALVAQVQQKIETDIQGFRLTLDSYGVRHAFGGHSQEWGSRDHYPLTEADVLALPEWVFAPTAMLAEAARSSSLQPQRMRLEHIDGQQVKTVVILEIRPKYRRLVLVTMYKTKNG